jgi:acyl carrier protein
LHPVSFVHGYPFARAIVMKSDKEVKTALRDWIAQKSKIRPEEINNETPFLEQRIISSIQLMELILFMEDLSGTSIDVKALKKGMLRDIDTIYRNFFEQS